MYHDPALQDVLKACIGVLQVTLLGQSQTAAVLVHGASRALSDCFHPHQYWCSPGRLPVTQVLSLLQYTMSDFNLERHLYKMPSTQLGIQC